MHLHLHAHILGLILDLSVGLSHIDNGHTGPAVGSVTKCALSLKTDIGLRVGIELKVFSHVQSASMNWVLDPV